MRRSTLLALVFLCTFITSNAMAWGKEGHDVVVRLAFRMMSPAERNAAFELLGPRYYKQYSKIGNWADRVKGLRHTANWHYVDIRSRDKHYHAERDCPNGDCIIEALERARANIRDHSLSDSVRREALLYWFHLAGDLYQPFHCIDKNEGGNTLYVMYYGMHCKLHALWDKTIITLKDSSAVSLAETIAASHKRLKLPPQEIVEAAQRSHRRAVKDSYRFRNNHTIRPIYVERSWRTIKASLWEAACLVASIGPDV